MLVRLLSQVLFFFMADEEVDVAVAEEEGLVVDDLVCSVNMKLQSAGSAFSSRAPALNDELLSDSLPERVKDAEVAMK